MNQTGLQLIQEELAHAGEPSLGSTARQSLMQHRITPTTALPPMEALFRIADVPCFYRGELVAVCGKAKSGKTLFLSILMASCLTNKMLALNRTAGEPLKVLWLDTEQSQQSTQDILVNRILPLSDISPQSADIDQCFYAFNLRGLGYEKRRELMEHAMTAIQPDLAVIDGIKDLVTDINDAVQATVLMEQLMALAQRNNCSLVCVLHQNKSEADHNMRGSIGTELTNKAFEVYQCSRLADGDCFKVKQSLSRREHIRQSLYYQLDDKGIPFACDAPSSEQPRDEHGRWMSNRSVTENLQKLFTNAMEGRTQRPFNEVMAIALKKCGIPDAKTYYAVYREAEEQGIIRSMRHPDTEATWVELKDNALPF